MAPKKDGAFKNECPRTAIVPIFLTRAVDVPVELRLDGRLATMLVATINIIIFSNLFLFLCRLLFSLKEYSDNTSLAAKGALTHRLQHMTAQLIQNGRWGLERGLPLDFGALPSSFSK